MEWGGVMALKTLSRSTPDRPAAMPIKPRTDGKAAPPKKPVCNSCRGMTYYTSAMKAAGQRSVCVGLRGTSDEVAGRSAEDDKIAETDAFSFTCFGCSRVDGVAER